MVEDTGNDAGTAGTAGAADNDGVAAGAADNDGAAEGTGTPAEGSRDTALAGEDKGKEVVGAPEAYEDFTVPEGVELQPDALTNFQGVAKELNLSQEAAQKLVNFQAEFMLEQATAAGEMATKMRTDWLEASKGDQEIGGQKFETTVEAGKRALEEFGTPELSSLLNESGIGNHPEMIRFAARVGAALGEDSFVPGGAKNASKSLAQRIYGEKPQAQ